jgi:hypothetical protein
MKCDKCRSCISVQIVTDEFCEKTYMLCPKCLCVFVKKLAEWKDFSIEEEAELFTGRR